MTYRDSLKHLIVEQQRQRLNTQQEQLIQQALRDHSNQMTTINDQLVHRLKRELNKINGHHVQRVVQFLKNL
jgi:ABC-type transport system involved in Fe-S cluster assembly fused permease/ATPase subunit